jgi:hypothetical protein
MKGIRRWREQQHCRREDNRVKQWTRRQLYRSNVSAGVTSNLAPLSAKLCAGLPQILYRENFNPRAPGLC